MRLNVPPSNPTATQPSKDDVKKKLKLVRAGHTIAESLSQGHIDQAIGRAVVSGIKLASDLSFRDPFVSPLILVDLLKTFGIEALAWKPETLFAAIDRKIGMSNAYIEEALQSFHETGVLKTSVPMQVRQKIYALRIIATSDTAHNQWHIFEKIGCAFNDRIANFGVVEKLSPGECARTISIIEAVRPDEYAKEIKVYVAASAHEDGLLTLQPSKYLRMADLYLQQLNADSVGAALRPEAVTRIAEKMKARLVTGPEDVETIQALKLLAIDSMGDEAAQHTTP